VKYAVMMECRSGTRRMVDSAAAGCYWEDVYTVITWTVEDDRLDALSIAARLQSNSREVRRAWVEERPVSEEGCR
jgi:hypothetical protein